MTQQLIGIGAVADDGTGDNLRVAFNKTNLNFTELYGGTTGRAQRLVTATPIVVLSNDQIIICQVASPALCVLPLASTRIGGLPLTFKDVGQATANNITLMAGGGDTIDGAPSYLLRNNYAWATFVPFLDGVHTGWMVL